MPTIAIVGAGISGLHLALRLQQAGMPTTLYTERGAEELAEGRPVNLVVRFEHTRERDRVLGVDHWDRPECGMYGVGFSALGGELALEFFGSLTRPASAVDFRIYLPRLLSDYAERGGTVDRITAGAPAIAAIADRHDLVVVSSGRRSIAELFPRDPARSPYTAPQRIITAGYFTGIAPMPEGGVHFQLCPGVGEVFCTRMLSVGGLAHGLNIEAVPGGPLERVAHLSYDEDPAGFRRSVLRLLAEHAPALRARVDERIFDLVRPIDLLKGAITPTVRTGWAALPEGGYAMALGDAWVVNDPVVGQGANLGSHSAFVLADAILAGPPYDEAFCRAAEARMWEFGRSATEWSNAFLMPPAPHAIELLAGATQDRRIADAFADNFNDPQEMWRLLGSPAETRAWLAEFGASPTLAAAPG
ncbi:MAG: styrene monooxygenase/indole monooxygenase family protein [Labedaea sp.]